MGLLQEGVGNLLRQAGLELMHLVMEEEVKSLAGERHEQHGESRAHRGGKEAGYCVVDGQKVPMKRTRLRGTSPDGGHVRDSQDAYGVEKSAVSDNFIEASREKVKQLRERPRGAVCAPY